MLTSEFSGLNCKQFRNFRADLLTFARLAGGKHSTIPQPQSDIRKRIKEMLRMLRLSKSSSIKSKDNQVKKQEEEAQTSPAVEDSQMIEPRLRNSASKTLPDEIIEKIIAMMPFPQIFKARALSKSWLARLSSISFQGDEEKKRLAIFFQRQVGECSINWNTFCPVLIGQDDFVAYDRVSHIWRRFPSLSFLPENLLENRWSSKIEIEGTLLLVSTRSKTSMYVYNILTRCWKQLPPCPPANRKLCHGELPPSPRAGRTLYLGETWVNQTPLAYKVLVF